jgi:hypothetical protein
MKPESEWAAFEVNGCSIVPVKLQKMLQMWKAPDKIQEISICRCFFKFLSKVQVPAFPVHTTFFLLLHHVFVRHSTSSVQEPCIITEDEALEYYGF